MELIEETSMKRCINAKDGAPAVGPYSHATSAELGLGTLLFVSGQGPFARDGSGPVRGTIEEETHRAMENLKTVLEEAGSGFEHVLKTTVFLLDMGDFAAFNAIYASYFPANPPARSCIQAARLPADIRVEVEAIALVPKG
jgi:2-iminobutanoate/2-iminopropanoate deaminase